MKLIQNGLGEYRRDIDGLRGIAVLSVVIYHAFPRFIKGGFIGVDVFFVISGYLISEIILRESAAGVFSYVDFYARRARRLFPALILVLLVSLAAGWLVLWSAEYRSLGQGVAAGAGFVANLLLYGQSGYFDVTAHEKPLLHLWSLGVEEQFYLVWPTLLILTHRWRALWLVALLGLVSFLFCVKVSGTQQPAAFYLPMYRFWEFMIGFAVCRMGRSARAMHWRNLSFGSGRLALTVADLLSVIGLLGLGVGYAVIDQGKPFPGMAAALPTLAAGLLIFSGDKALANARVLGARGLVYFGLISYPLYLWHWPLMSFEYLMDYGDRTRVVSLVLIGLAWLLSDMTWRWIERPARRTRARWLPLNLFVGLCLVGAAGGYVAWQRGLPARLDENAGDLEKARQLTWSMSGWEKSCPQGIANSHGVEVICERFPPGRQGGQSVLLLGDSHAMAFAEALNQARDVEGLDFAGQIIAKGGCMPLAWVEKIHAVQECHPFYVSAYDYAVSDSSIETVILVGRWAARFHGSGFGIDTKRHDFRDVRRDRGERQEQLFSRTLRETIERLHAAGKKTIFVHQAPELGFNTKACLPRPFSFKPVHACSIERSQVEMRQAAYREVVREILADYPDVRVLDPMDEFCDENKCYGRREGDYLYTDNNHLSDTGARRLGAGLARLIKQP